MELRDTARATDGYELAVTRFPAQGKAWATALVAPAMAVRQEFYEPYARFLATNGVHAITFDYRGIGASRPDDLASLEANVMDWATKDFEAMLGEAHRAAPQLPLVLVGHSLGGQILGLAPSNAKVRAALHVVAGSGYYGFNERMRLRVLFLWFVAIPLFTRLYGYFPGRKLRMIGDLPRGAALQWRRWCTHPLYALSEGEAARESFDRVTARILSYSFADDPMIDVRAVDSLNGFFRNARIEHRHVDPRAAGASVGHFGFFVEASGARLWRESLDWLREALPAQV